MDDFSPEMPVSSGRGSMLDPYKPFVDAILEADRHVWRKQRHTAKRIYERLAAETPYEGGYGIVKRYVRERRAQMRASDMAFMELVWAPGEAQADFGDVDVLFRGELTRMHFFVLSFPFSNMGFCQLFAGGTSECVCQGLKDAFGRIGGVPHRIVFDNATGAGRRCGAKVTEAELFSRMRAHYGFEAAFANPYSGQEKGNVERKVGWLRQHLFTPAPVVDDLAEFNRRLLDRCDSYAGTPHYEKGPTWGELFERDRAALLPLPARPFSCVRYGAAAVDKRGCAVVDGGHRYHVSDAMAGRSVTVAYGAAAVAFADAAGEVLAEHARRFGSAPCSPDPASQLGLLAKRPGAWRNSPARAALPRDGLLGGRCRMSARTELGARARAAFRAVTPSNHTAEKFASEAATRDLRLICALPDEEVAWRERSKRERLLKRARFPVPKTFEGYDWARIRMPEGMTREAVESCEFVGRMQNLVLYGGVGNGKAHMAIACGTAACNKGPSVMLATISDLVVRMQRAEEAGALDRVFREVERADLVMLDELGYLPIDRQGARLLFQVVSKCYERRSLIVTTNLEFSRWGSVLTDDQMAAAMIDRIIHYGHLVVFEGPTKRMEASPMARRA